MSRRRSRQMLVGSIALWTLVSLAASASGPPSRQAGRREAPEDMSQYLPPGDGRALVVEGCSTCHDLGGTVRLRASKERWEAVVGDMVARGAPLMIEEVDAITVYLSTVFEPKAPPLVDINSADRYELMRIPGVDAVLADGVIAHRKQNGPFSSRDQLRTVIGFDAAAFEKIKWYLRVSGSRPDP